MSLIIVRIKVHNHQELQNPAASKVQITIYAFETVLSSRARLKLRVTCFPPKLNSSLALYISIFVQWVPNYDGRLQ